MAEQVLAPNSEATESQVKNFVNKVEVKFRTIKVNKLTRPQPGQAPLSSSNVDEFLTPKIINKLNRCVIEICSGNLDKARTLFDEVVTNSEENGGLGMREITCECDAAQMLPAYLVTLLTYFYLRVKNLKMARALIKARRFVVDTDHIVQQLKTPQAQPQTQPSTTHKTQHPKKPQVMMNYKSIAKNFT